MPLVGALGSGEPMVPVTIAGQGPYLFVIDVGRPSAIDPRLAAKLGLPVTSDSGPGASPYGSDGSDGAAPTSPGVRRADIANLQAGTLTLTGVRFEVRPTRAMYHGRKVQGTLGTEVFAAGVVWTIDRDRQLVTLALPSAQPALPDAERVPLRVAGSEYFVDAVLNDEHAVELQIASVEQSTLSPALAQQADLRVLDQRAWLADSVQLGEISAYEQLFLTQSVPLSAEAGAAGGGSNDDDDSEEDSDGDGGDGDGGDDTDRADGVDEDSGDADGDDAAGEDGAVAAGEGSDGAGRARAAAAGGATAPGRAGTLGQDFFRGFRVTMSRSQLAMWLAERADDQLALTGERLDRWGPLFDGCEQPACAILTITDGASATVMLAADDDSGAAEPSDAEGDGGGADEPPDADAAQPGTPQPREQGQAEARRGAAQGAAGEDAGDTGGGGGPLSFDADATVLIVERDARMSGVEHDLLLAGFDEVDVPLPAPYLLVAMPKNVTRVAFELSEIDSAYLRATSFQVIDATPVPPPCKERAGCVWLHR
ncbi:MAG: hypothetical protein Tsb0020_35380 [Haliangiales bacterium]